LRPYISFSEWLNFRNECQWKWKLDYLDGHRSKAYGIHMDFGTAVHEAIEHHRTRNNPVSVDAAVEIFKKKFKDLTDENWLKYEEKDRKNKLPDFFAAGERILRGLHLLKELAEAEVVYNEHELFIPIDRSDGTQISFKGFIDMVVKTKDKRGHTILYIVDFKTCSWGWMKEKKQDRNLHFQLFLYKHFLCKKFNLDPQNVRCAFVLLKRTPRDGDIPLEWFQVSAGPVSVQRALDELNRDLTIMKNAIEKQTLQKNPKSCVNKFGQKCPYSGTSHCDAIPAATEKHK
jgi:hypothetical protein